MHSGTANGSVVVSGRIVPYAEPFVDIKTIRSWLTAVIDMRVKKKKLQRNHFRAMWLALQDERNGSVSDFEMYDYWCRFIVHIHIYGCLVKDRSLKLRHHDDDDEFQSDSLEGHGNTHCIPIRIMQ